MITMSTYTVYEYMKWKFPDLSEIIKNGTLDKTSQKSIGVFQGSDTRSQRNLAIGGIDCTIVRMLPININMRWTDNQKSCDDKAIEIYNALLLETNNFTFQKDGVKIACIELLDSCPIQLGRDDKNVCEVTIRANFYYYVMYRRSKT